MSKLVRRKPWGETFTYLYASGTTVKNAGTRRWIESLAIPPAWTEVEIDLDRDAKVHAHGRDAKGRKQYLYNPDWTEQRSRKKFKRILRFADQLETMRRVTGQHLRAEEITRQKVLAAMTRMLDEAYFRPGSANYTRNNDSYGLTTLRGRHLSFCDDRVVFDYVGKSQKEQHREINDERLLEVLRELDEMTGYELFDITDEDGEREKLGPDDLNEYINEIMGEDFSAKDFRTWAGTLLMAIALDELGPVDDDKRCQSNVLDAIERVAEDLGNTPAVTRDNYVHPGVIRRYEDGQTLDYFRRQLEDYSSKHMSIDEKATIELLKKTLD